jgi:hypothetical protein
MFELILRTTIKDERPPAMHSAVAWCKRGDINQMIKLAAYRFQGIAGRSNVQRRTSNNDLASLRRLKPHAYLIAFQAKDFTWYNGHLFALHFLLDLLIEY